MTPPEYLDPNSGVRVNLVYVKVLDVTEKVSTDQTGRFPITSIRGSKYSMVMHNNDIADMIVEALHSRAKIKLLQATENSTSTSPTGDSNLVCTFWTTNFYLR